MLRKRIIPIIQLKDDELVKSIKFKNHKYVGDPLNVVKIFNEIKVDEIIILDVFKSKQNEDINFKIIKDLADECKMPFTYGGGIKNFKQVEKLFSIGVEKISLNTSILDDYNFIKDLSKLYGSQSILVSIDIKKNLFGKRKLIKWSNNKSLNINFQDHINKCIDNGAGEILINDVSNEGTLKGFDFEILSFIEKNLKVPIILNGGINSYDQINKILENKNIDAVAVGAFFTYYGPHRAVLISYMPDDERK